MSRLYDLFLKTFPLFIIIPSFTIAGIIVLIWSEDNPNSPYNENFNDCLLSRNTQHVWLNENNEVIYREPRDVCDVERFGHTYHYSYYMQANYSKPWWTVYPDCDGAVFNNQTMNFICPDGSIAKELRFKY